MNKPNFVQKLLCRLGEHSYDFKTCPMRSEAIWIEGKQAWLHTYKCACCGRVRRDITFECGGELTDCHESILDDVTVSKRLLSD